jgi:NitT/TauT family transport system permease protein
MRPRRLRTVAARYGQPLLALAAMGVAWHLVTAVFSVPAWLLPSPRAVGGALYHFRQILPVHFWVTLLETVVGFLLSIVVGVPLAILIVWSPVLQRTIYPILLAAQSIPKVALAPLFLVWIGYGMSSKILVVVSVAFFPIVVDTVTGLMAVEPDLLDMVKVLRASTLQTFVMIRMPASLPYFFSGTKVAVTLAVIGSVIGEFVGADRGLGYLIQVSGSQLKTDLVFGVLAILSLMGMALFVAVEWLQRLLCPWSVGH